MFLCERKSAPARLMETDFDVAHQRERSEEHVACMGRPEPPYAAPRPVWVASREVDRSVRAWIIHRHVGLRHYPGPHRPPRSGEFYYAFGHHGGVSPGMRSKNRSTVQLQRRLTSSSGSCILNR
jgi:hypothetical protein